MSIVGALILGNSAVSAGFASETTVIVVALSSISAFLTPKLFGPITFWSTFLIIIGAVAGLPGFFVAFFMLLSEIGSLKSCGFKYLFPMGTLKKFNFRDLILRDDSDSISRDFTDDCDKI